MAEITKTLTTAIQKDIAWHWDTPQNVAFKMLKKLLSEAPILRYFNKNEDIIQVDASKFGLGATLFQGIRHGIKRIR